MVGCDGDAKVVKSGEDESCVQTSDCSEGLKCFNNVCFKTATGGGNEGGDGTGGTTSGPPGPVLGGEGESCDKRADCEAGLGCFNQRCVDAASGDGGAGPGGVTLGSVGETCGLTSDCGPGLACLPQGGGNFSDIRLKAGSNSVGVCSYTDSGIEPTGNECGAECLVPEDCCELPVEVHALWVDALGLRHRTGVNSCAELASVLDGVNCNAAVLTGLNAARCFAQATYCDCANDTWACTNGRCGYDATCSADDATPGGCPTYSRAGNILTNLCDTLGTEKCQPPAVTTSCKADADCTGELVADSAGLDSCVAGECTCYKPNGLCYRKCGEDLDCPVPPGAPVRTTCDTKAKVCVSGDSCTSDAACAVLQGDFRFKCIEGACEFECVSDLDCNYAITNGGLQRVCNANKRCESIGCTADEECPGTAFGVRLFCAPKVPSVPGVSVYSATTD